MGSVLTGKSRKSDFIYQESSPGVTVRMDGTIFSETQGSQQVPAAEPIPGGGAGGLRQGRVEQPEMPPMEARASWLIQCCCPTEQMLIANRASVDS